MSSPTLELTQALIRRPSVTPDDAGCQELLGERLAAAGFTLTPMRFGDVDNLWARRGSGQPLLVLAGHTDVVPTGNPADWHSDPFEPVLREGFLYGRGAADMKASLAAFVTAIERFVASHPDHRGSLGVLLTSDEEGPAVDGTVRVVEQLLNDGVTIDYCLVGEPSSLHELGDTMRNGRRGSLTGILTVLGVQGHVAYPETVRNPIHAAALALADLSRAHWDDGNAFYPPTSFQVTNIAAGTGADNVVPGRLDARFNFRYCTESTVDQLTSRVEDVLAHHGLEYRLEWQHSGAPFITESGRLLDVVAEVTRAVLGAPAAASTGGGTSDGRFIRPAGAEVIELGPVNATIHKVNERVAVNDIDRLSVVYEAIIERLVT